MHFVVSRRIVFSLTLGLLICTGLASPAGAADKGRTGQEQVSDLVHLNGTRLNIKAPAGMTKADNFAGFIDPNTNASLMVTEMPAPFKQLTEGFTDERLAARGMQLVGKQSKEKGEYQGLEVDLTQKLYGTSVKKHVYIFGNDNFSIVATATLLEGTPDSIMAKLREAIYSITIDTTSQPSLDEGLPYKLKETANLKRATRLQNTLLFNKAGKTNPPEKGPLFLSSQSIMKVRIEQPDDFARRRIKDTPYVKDMEIEKEQDIELSGLKGRKLLARGVDAKTAEKTFVYMILLFEKDGYYILQGISPESMRPIMEKEFDEISGSFKLL